MATFILITLGLAFLYGMLAIGLYIIQPLLVYRMNPERKSPASVGLDNVDEIKLESPDGNTIIAWYSKAEPGRPTILYFHGTSGNLAHRKERILRFTSQGYGVLMPSYRGYSGSTGRPSQSWNMLDGFMAYDFLIDEGVSKSQIILYGESLGTGVATPIAVGRDVAALILEAPFTTIVDVAEARYPYFPIRQFMLDRYESIDVINRVRAPILIVHGEKDELIPVELGRELYQAAPEPKRLAIIKDAGHTRLMRLGAWNEIQDFIENQVLADNVFEIKRPVIRELQSTAV